MKEKLAINGGTKKFDEEVERYNSIGKEELLAATKVIESGTLSQFLGEKDQDFYGGPKIREFENRWSEYFKVQYSVSVNSCTSGLMVALGAIGLEPGDEVIVSPWTMCASATSILIWNAIPVFADIEDETFNLDPQSIEKNITPNTKAIVVTNIFGHAAKLHEIMLIAKKYNLRVIEDNAQAPGALCNGEYTGTIGDIGVFSLNYHKHIHTGEGGMCVTNNAELSERMQLIRNHAEAVVEDKGENSLVNMIGFNFRMGEIEAAIGVEQLKKLPYLINEKVEWAEQLSEGLSSLDCLRTPVVRDNCSHVYYAYPMLLDIKLNRDTIHNALVAEGIPFLAKEFGLTHLLPIYQKKIAYGKSGYPWNGSNYTSNVKYNYGICPTAENILKERYMNFGIGLLALDKNKITKIIDTFNKVWDELVI